MTEKLRSLVIGAHWLLTNQLGINTKRFFKVLCKLPPYIKDYKKFKNLYNGKILCQPCLLDADEQSGNVHDEYFWQDLYVANKVFGSHPIKHVDIGSRIDGFIAHLASFRSVEVFDIRPINTKIHNIQFTRADLMNLKDQLIDYCDSLSCLHTIEHFGLGRYGDDINPQGHILGLKNISKILASGGTFYLSTPIGASKVYFNAHRIINPFEILDVMNDLFSLKSLAFVSPDTGVIESTSFLQDLKAKSSENYNLAIFEFVKK